MWANEKPSAYLKRIRSELVTVINKLNDGVSPDVKNELLLSAESITDYQDVCSLLDKIDFIMHGPELL